VIETPKALPIISYEKFKLKESLYLGCGASMAPKIVPISALATVIPRLEGLSAAVFPEITAVSKPKRSPPMDATMVLLINGEDSFTVSLPSRILSL
jgi:hypothetical protein